MVYGCRNLVPLHPLLPSISVSRIRSQQFTLPKSLSGISVRGGASSRFVRVEASVGDVKFERVLETLGRSRTLEENFVEENLGPSIAVDWQRALECCEVGQKLNVAVLLSGGVDSSVALRLLCAAGHTCTAFYLKIWFQVCYLFEALSNVEFVFIVESSMFKNHCNILFCRRTSRTFGPSVLGKTT